MSIDIATAIATPEAYGFMWDNGEVGMNRTGEGAAHKGSPNYVSLGHVPLAKVTDVVTFEEHFPGVILASLDGSSIRVKVQGVARRMKQRDHGVSDEAIMKAEIRALLGIKASATPATMSDEALKAEMERRGLN